MTRNTDLNDIRCIIFDFDGVILDSSLLKTECFRKLYSQYEDIYEEAMAYHLKNKGISRYKQFDHIARNFMNAPEPSAIVSEMTEKFARIVFEALARAPFIPGAKELLEFLLPMIPLYVISSAPHDELKQTMKSRDLEFFFKDYFGSVDSKDKYIEQILEKEKIYKEQVLFIGDTLNDYKAAKSSGVHFCGVKNNLADFSGIDCICVSDLFELKMILSRFNRDIK